MVVFALFLALPLFLALTDGALDDVVRLEVSLALLWSAALAVAFRVLPRAYWGRSAAFMAVAGAGVLAWGVASLIWTESTERTYLDLTREVLLISVPILCLLGLRPDTWRQAAAGLSTALLIVPVVAFLTRVWPELILEARLDAIFAEERLSYPLDYWNALACWAAMAVVAGVAWSAHVQRADLRALALAPVPIAIGTLYLTYSRGGMVALVVGLGAVVLFSTRRSVAATHALGAVVLAAGIVFSIRAYPEIADATGSEGAPLVIAVAVVASLAAAALTRFTRSDEDRAVRRLRVAAACALAAGIVLIGSFSLNGFAGGVFEGQILTEDDPATRLLNLDGSRASLWEESLDSFSSEPLTGSGPGTFDLVWERGGADREGVRDAHSLPIETLGERGLPGLIVLLAFLGGLAALVVGAKRSLGSSRLDGGAAAAMSSVFVVFLVQALVDWMWEVTAVAVAGLAAAGIVASATSRSRTRSFRSGLRVALVVLAVVAGASLVPALTSEQRLRASDTALAGGDLERAIEIAGDAVDAAPWNASPYAWRASLELEAGDFDSARADTESAIENEPTEPQHRLLLARVAIVEGDLDAARSAVLELGRLSPDFRVDPDAVLDQISPESPVTTPGN